MSNKTIFDQNTSFVPIYIASFLIISTLFLLYLSAIWEEERIKSISPASRDKQHYVYSHIYKR